MRLVLLGPPGAGKGTQAKTIVEEFQIPHVSTGDIFRSNISEETELGQKVKSYLDQGALVPDELTIDMVWDRLDEEDTQDGFLLDGFPRTLPQAEALQSGLKERGLRLDHVILINVDRQALVRRLTGRRVCPNCGASYHIDNNPPRATGICDICGSKLVQREDDAESVMLDRIKVYENETAPLIDFYREQGLLIDIDGNQKVDVVAADIQKALQ